MTIIEFLTLLTRAVFLLVAALTLIDFLRYRDSTRLDIFLVFGSLAFAIIGGLFTQITGLSPEWLITLDAMAVVAHPYLLLRLLFHFRRTPDIVVYPAIGGLIISWVLLIIAPPPRPTAVTLFIVFYFVAVEAYTAITFVRSALTAGGVTRRRLLLVSAGTALLALAILIAGVRAVVPDLANYAAIMVQALAILSALFYYLGFAPPRWLRRAWQLSELYNYLRQTPVLSAQKQIPAMLTHLCQVAERSVGGKVAAVALWDDKEEQLVIRATSHQPSANDKPPKLSGSFITLQDGPIGRAWRDRRPVCVRKPAEFGPEETQLTTLVDAAALFAVPIATENRVWGLLLVFLRRAPLFTNEDMKLLTLFTEQSAVALNYSSLLMAERALIEKLNLNNAQLQATTQELEAFAYSVSHDLRAPLRALDGFSEALIQEYSPVLDETGQHYLARIRAASQRMGQLIDDLLNLSRVTRSELHHEKVDVTSIAREIVEEIQRREDKCSADFTIAENMRTYGDGRLIRVLLENLFDNACKFSRGCPQPTIELGSFEKPDGVRGFFIRDNGVGFDMAYADKLFGAFQRLHSISEFPGTGIGLATAQRIVHRHGGRIWAEAAVGQGATFYFCLEQQKASRPNKRTPSK